MIYSSHNHSSIQCTKERKSMNRSQCFILVVSLFLGAAYFFYQLPLYSYKPTKHTKATSQPTKPSSHTKAAFNNKCGVVMFFHIPKTGGGTVLKWLETNFNVLNTRRLIKEKAMTAKNQEDKKKLETMWKSILATANEFVNNVSPRKGWQAIHLHNFFPGMYYNRNIIRDWKTIVEGKGCVFHKTTILRDPLSRFVSNYNYYTGPLNEVGRRMSLGRNELSRYLLFGTCSNIGNDLKCGYKNNSSFWPIQEAKYRPYLNENYRRELVKVINEFDSIGFLDGFDEYLEHIKNITGLKDDRSNQKKTKKVHKSKDHLHLTSDMLENFLKLNQDDYLLYYNIKNALAPRRLALSIGYDLLNSKICV